ncbi:HipA N-terminal domain-containing protein [Fulvivirga sp.]|uniref:HipA N-terminal domain-containing protein n=1 Tax=Fulvivirga sp. TaxID=1931237 RepID=UPI0032EFFC2A
MERTALVYNQGIYCGSLTKNNQEYIFSYDPGYVENADTFPVSLTLPKRMTPYHSAYLFPFFYGLLAEGVNKKTQCRLLKIDEEDHFSLLIKTAHTDTIGGVTLKDQRS